MVDVKERNEQWFKNKVLDFWKHGQCVWATPIQTRTVPGVPDVYVGYKYNQVMSQWIEFKRIKTKYIDKAYTDGQYSMFKVPFREGQQAWAAKHYEVTKRCVIVWVMFDDVAVWFPIREIRANRMYSRGEMHICDTDIQEAVYGKNHWDAVLLRLGVTPVIK